MLYDILPPLVFFVSLGGIILVVGRVVTRIRRQQFAVDVNARVAASGARAMHSPSKLAGLLGPTKRRIEIVKSPAALIANVKNRSVGNIRSELKHRRQQRQQRIAHRSEASAAARIAPGERRSREAARRPRRQEPNNLTNLAAGSATPSIKPPRAPLRERFGSLISSVSSGAGQAVANMRPSRKAANQRYSDRTAADQQIEPPARTAPTPAPLKHRAISLGGEEPTTAIPTEPHTKPARSGKAAPESKQTPAAPAPVKNTLRAKLRSRQSKQPDRSALDQAQDALKAAQLDQVEEILVPYIVKHPKDAKAYMLLGQAASAKEDWEDAVQAFEYVVSLNPRTKGCLAKLGHATYKAGKMTKAIELLQQAHSAEPHNKNIIKDLITIAQRLDNKPMQQSFTAELKEMEAAR